MAPTTVGARGGLACRTLQGVSRHDEQKASRFARGGFALRVAAGGESWVSTHWALGFNVRSSVGRNVDREGTMATWTSRGIGVGFT